MVAALISDFVTRVAVVLVGMLYPGYKSFKAVKAQDIPAQQRWLHYWLVLSIVSTAMLVLQPLLSGRVPFFNMIKIVVIGALVHPKIAGYQKIYDAVVEPFIDQHMATIDTKLNQLDKATQDAATNLVPTARKYAIQARDMASRSMQKQAPAPKKAS